MAENEQERLDDIAVLTGDLGLSDNMAIYQAISDASRTSPMPILPVLSSLSSCQDRIEAFIRQGNVFFPDEVAMGRAMGKVADWVAPAVTLAEPPWIR